MSVIPPRPSVPWPPARTALAVGAALLATGVFALGSAIDWGTGTGSDAGSTLSDFMGGFGLALAAILAAASSVRRALQLYGRMRVSWLLFAGSALVAGFGNALWGWYELLFHQPPPFPCQADWAFLCFAPLAIAGTLTHHRGLGGALAWVRLVLDGALIGGALFTAGWWIAMSKNAFGVGHDQFKVTFALAYPVFGIMLVSLVLALRGKGRGRDRASMAMLVLGYTVIVFFDALSTLPGNRAHYDSGELLNSGWFLGFLLLAIAPWVSVWAEETERPDTPCPWREGVCCAIHRVLQVTGLIFPYLAGSTCLVVVLAEGLRCAHRVHPVPFCTACAVLAALAARQAVTLTENHLLTKQLSLRENHFRSLVQGAGEVIMTLTRPGRLGYISPAVTRVLGYEPQQLIGSSFWDLIHAQDRDNVVTAVDRFLAGVSPAALVECRIRAARARSLPTVGEGAQSIWRHTEATVTRHHGGLVFTIRDVSDRVALQNQLAHHAYHDALTGLPNRALFTERLEQAVGLRSAADHPPAVLFLDLDWFKEVNDAHGHAAGDALLIEAAARLRDAVRLGDTVARFGGDEFAALVHADPDGEAAREVAQRLHEAFTAPFDLDAGRFLVGASIGVAFWRPGNTAAQLLRRADLAMYEAKNAGKGRIVVRDAPRAPLIPKVPLIPKLHFEPEPPPGRNAGANAVPGAGVTPDTNPQPKPASRGVPEARSPEGRMPSVRSHSPNAETPGGET